MNKAKLSAFNCSNCGASVTVRGFGRSLSVVCKSCGAVLDLTNENYAIISQCNLALKINPLIPLGQRGKLRGTEWEVIGFMERQDTIYTDFYWYEYLLFNPRYGYKWLTENNGHWNYVTVLKDKPILDSEMATGRPIAKLLYKKYHLFNAGSARITFVLGEFYWRIRVNDMVQVSDYVHPPYLLSVEKTLPDPERKDQEENWSMAEYIEPNEIQEAFKLDYELPAKTGIAPNQPSEYKANSVRVWQLWALFVAAIFILQMGQAFRGGNNTIVYQNSFNSVAPINGKAYYGQLEFNTPSFELKEGVPNLEIELKSYLVNNWLSVDGELVNEITGQSYPFNQTIEYYSGWDSDGSWSEGSQQNTNLISGIPNGKYHLNFEPTGSYEGKLSSGTNQPYPPHKFDLILKRGIPIWSNLFWALLWLSLPPIAYLFMEYNFEVRRWQNSDYL